LCHSLKGENILNILLIIKNYLISHKKEIIIIDFSKFHYNDDNDNNSNNNNNNNNRNNNDNNNNNNKQLIHNYFINIIFDILKEFIFKPKNNLNEIILKS